MVRIVSVSGIGIDCFSESNPADGVVFEKENNPHLDEKVYRPLKKKIKVAKLSLGKNILCSSLTFNSSQK